MANVEESYLNAGVVHTENCFICSDIDLEYEEASLWQAIKYFWDKYIAFERE